jgi:hypothetical protein
VQGREGSRGAVSSRTSLRDRVRDRAMTVVTTAGIDREGIKMTATRTATTGVAVVMIDTWITEIVSTVLTA